MRRHPRPGRRRGGWRRPAEVALPGRGRLGRAPRAAVHEAVSPPARGAAKDHIGGNPGWLAPAGTDRVTPPKHEYNLQSTTACFISMPPEAGLAFGFLEDPLCKVFALSKLLRKTPCSGLEPGKPLFQRFSWLRFFCIVKFTLFFAAFALKIERLRRRRLFWRRRRNFLDLSVWGARKTPFSAPKNPLCSILLPPGKTPCAAF